MGTNIASAESAILTGTARSKRFWARFMQQWQQPVVDAAVLRWWDTLPPEKHAEMKKQFPGEYAEMRRNIEALRDREE